MKRRRSSAEVSKLVEEYRASGMSHREFAGAKGVPVSTVSGWVRRAAPAQRADRTALVPVIPKLSQANRGSVVRIDLPCGRRVEVQGTISPDVLEDLLSVLDRRTC